MNTWKPTEGLKRSERVVQAIEASALPCGIVLHDPSFRWRMVELIAAALDQALRDGSEMDALASVVGNGTYQGVPVVSDRAFGREDVPRDLWEKAKVPPLPDEERVLNTQAAIASGIATATPKKRGRGRPKGSTKAKKAKPQAEPTEMQP